MRINKMILGVVLFLAVFVACMGVVSIHAYAASVTAVSKSVSTSAVTSAATPAASVSAASVSTVSIATTHKLNISAAAFIPDPEIEIPCALPTMEGYVYDSVADHYRCAGRVMIPLPAGTQIVSIKATVDASESDDWTGIYVKSVNMSDGGADQRVLYWYNEGSTDGVKQKTLSNGSTKTLTMESDHSYHIYFDLGGTTGAGPKFYGVTIEYN